MQQKIHIVDETSLLDKYFPLVQNSKILGADIETTGLSPYKGDIRTLQLSDHDNTLVIDIKKIGREAVSNKVKPILEDADTIKIFHNAKFDLKFIKKQLNINAERIFDSYLGSLMCEAGINMPKGWHGLGPTAKRYTDIDISKEEQLSDWSGELSTTQLEYAAKDAQVLLPLRERMREKLKEMSLVRCADLEFHAIMPIVWLELSGFYLNIEQWKAIAAGNQIKADEVAQEIFAELEYLLPQGSLFGQTGFNLDSWQQVNKYFKEHGVPMPESTREWLLTPLVDRYPIVGKLLKYRKLTKSVTAFGPTWEEFIDPTTGRIHADFAQIGAETGRLAPRKPNINQIPSDDTHRNCFQSEEGNMLISADYSQIELRLLADLANDSNAIKAFESGDDYHQAMAAKVFKKPLSTVSKDERSFAKRLNFGIPYGMGVTKFAFQCNISLVEAQNIMDDYFRAVPAEKRWLKFQKQQVLRTKYARSASGRIAKYIFDEADGAARSHAQNNATNHPIQGSASDILKRALRLFYNKYKHRQDEIRLVNVVHDEINIEVPIAEVENSAETLKNCMLEAANEFVRKVPVKVEVSVQKMWQK